MNAAVDLEDNAEQNTVEEKPQNMIEIKVHVLQIGYVLPISIKSNTKPFENTFKFRLGVKTQNFCAALFI